MFVDLFSKLFKRKKRTKSPSVSNNKQVESSLTNATETVRSSNEDKQEKENTRQNARNAVLAEIQNSKIKLRRADLLFYDYLLGSQTTVEVSSLEQELLVNINHMLSNPAELLDSLPKLPQSVNQLMGLLDSDDFDVQTFCRVVEKDPTIATQLIAIANSAHYNPSGNEVSDIKRAFTLLGTQGVKEHVLLVFIKGLTNVPMAYYRTFGEKIWTHSDETAVICRELAQKRGLDPDTAFLIGLVHDIGKIFIFKLIVDVFRRSHPDEKLGSTVIKKLLHQKSLQLSVLITKQWKMPKVIVDAISDLAKQKQKSVDSPYGCLLSDANFVNEWQLIIAAGLAIPEEFELSKIRKPLSEDACHYSA